MDTNETVIPVETTSTETTATEALAPQGGDQVVTPPANEAYTPDFTYKVVNEVKEFDPRLRGLIKTKEDEQWARDLVTKAEGLEVNKRNLDAAAKERDHYKSAYEKEYTPLKKEVDQVLQMLDKKDFLSAFTVLGATEKDIINLAYQLVSASELPEHHKQAYNERNELNRSHYTLRQQNEEMQKQLESIQLQQRQTELTNIINTEYGSIAKEFDSRNGQGSFWNEVVQRGASYAKFHGVVKTPQEVIGEIVNVYGLKREVPKPAQVVSSGQGALPVIPNTGASGVAPVMKKNKTIAELKAYAKTLED